MRLKDVGKDGRRKLTDREVYDIKRSKKTQRFLADKYGVSHQRISAIQDRNGTQDKIKKRDTAIYCYRYNHDKKFRQRHINSKLLTYQKRKKFLGKKYKIYGDN